MSGTKRRFIAGAVCPRCGELDRIVMWEADGLQHRECISCGFTDSTDPETGLGAVPKGRLDAPRPPAPGDAKPTAQPIKFYPRPKKS